MWNKVSTKQEIVNIYNMLGRAYGNFVNVEQKVSDTLFDALSVFVGGGPDIPETAITEIKLKNVELLVFYFKKMDIFEEVYKRTSIIGKVRTTKEGVSLLDRIALTQDEMSMFETFFSDAASMLLQSVAPFTRMVSQAFLLEYPSGIKEVEEKEYKKGDRVLYLGKVYELNVDIVVTSIDPLNLEYWTEVHESYYTDDKVEYVLMQPDWFNINFIYNVDKSISEAIICYIIHKWFAYVLPEEAGYYASEYQRYQNNVISNMNENNRPMARRHKFF